MVLAAFLFMRRMAEVTNVTAVSAGVRRRGRPAADDPGAIYRRGDPAGRRGLRDQRPVLLRRGREVQGHPGPGLAAAAGAHHPHAQRAGHRLRPACTRSRTSSAAPGSRARWCSCPTCTSQPLVALRRAGLLDRDRRGEPVRRRGRGAGGRPHPARRGMIEGSLGLERFLIAHGPAAVVVGAALEGDMTLSWPGSSPISASSPFPPRSPRERWEPISPISSGFWSGSGAAPRCAIPGCTGTSDPRSSAGRRRFGPIQLVASRFIYGTRIASMVFWGLAGLPLDPVPARSTWPDPYWAPLVFGALGWVLSGSITVLVGHIRRVELVLLVALIIGAGIVLWLRAGGRGRGAGRVASPQRATSCRRLPRPQWAGDLYAWIPTSCSRTSWPAAPPALARAISVVENATPRLRATPGRGASLPRPGPPHRRDRPPGRRQVHAGGAPRRRLSGRGPQGRRHRGGSHQPLHRRRPAGRPHPHGIRRPRPGRLHPEHGQPRLPRRPRHDHARSLRSARCRRVRPDPGRDGRAWARASSTSPAWPIPRCWSWSPNRATVSRPSSPASWRRPISSWSTRRTARARTSCGRRSR